jgi:hypothetical protein
VQRSSPVTAMRPVLTGLIAVMLAAAYALIGPATSALAAGTTLYASPS